MRAAWLTALGIAAYLLFLALLAPASIVMAKADLPPGVSLADVQGTLWNGSARATVRQGSASLAIDRVEWHFVPSQLFTGRLAFDLRAESPKLHASGRLAHGFGGLSAQDVAASGDAATFAALFPMAAPW